MKPEFEIKGKKAISRGIGGEEKFEIVKQVPGQYHVWNIGENMGSDEYIPLCEMLKPNDPKCYTINVDTLKTIKLPNNEVMTLRKAASNGITNKERAEKVLKGKSMAVRSQLKRIYAERALEIFNRITTA